MKRVMGGQGKMGCKNASQIREIKEGRLGQHPRVDEFRAATEAGGGDCSGQERVGPGSAKGI